MKDILYIMKQETEGPEFGQERDKVPVQVSGPLLLWALFASMALPVT